jgi:NAD(P)-dependent dehydrogenase (short-subunit alcohol dehydrogenase family)
VGEHGVAHVEGGAQPAGGREVAHERGIDLHGNRIYRPAQRGINLTKALACEYAPDNVRVNTICIGLVHSAQIDRMAKGGDLEAHYARLAAERVPLGRVAQATEFADLFAFLVSDRASYITGTAINFDGGGGATV